MIDFEKLSIIELQHIIEKAHIALARKECPDPLQSAEKRITEFTNKWELVFRKKGEIGIGRDCVGLISGRQYVEYNPTDGDFNDLPEFYDERLNAPNDVNAYGKHRAFAVLVENENWNDATLQLDAWLTNILNQGEIEVVNRERKIRGQIDLIIGDPVVKTIRYKK